MSKAIHSPPKKLLLRSQVPSIFFCRFYTTFFHMKEEGMSSEYHVRHPITSSKPDDHFSLNVV
jgi:hypothetical protein